jgi:glucose-6-phosphate-specific signal transduction histidine kinase
MTVDADADPQRLRVALSDNGIGRVDVSGCTSLIGLRDRVEALWGRLLVSSPTGTDTTVVAEIPFTGP